MSEITQSIELGNFKLLSRTQVKKLLNESIYSWIPVTEELSNVIRKFDVTCLPARSQSSEINKELYIHDFFLYSHLLGRRHHDADALQSAWSSYVEDNEMQQNQLCALKRDWFEKSDGMKYFVHTRSLAKRINCAVRMEFNCPHCHRGDPKFNHSLRSHPDYVRKVGRELCIKILKLDKDQKFGEYALLEEETNRAPNAKALIKEVRSLKRDFSKLSEEFTSTKRDLHEQIASLKDALAEFTSKLSQQQQSTQALSEEPEDTTRLKPRRSDAPFNSSLSTILPSNSPLTLEPFTPTDDETKDFA